MLPRLPWQEELEIVDQTMKAISGVTDPEAFVEAYFNGVGKLIRVDHYVSISRRNMPAPSYLITRSSRFTEDINPWTQRDRLPKFSGGLLGEVAYANKPVIIDDLAARLSPDDPAYFYLEGFARGVALPQYDNGEALNVTVILLPPGAEIDPKMIPLLHWQSGLFGRGTQNLVLRNQLAEALEDLDEELTAVGDIQRSLLPETLPDIPGFELAANYQTSARAGGDYYDFFPLPNGRWGLFIADVSGHGTPAAVLMAITHAIAHAHPGTHQPPDALLTHLNEQLSRGYTRAGTFITAFYGILDPAARTLTYSRAGHNPPRLVKDGSVLALDGAGGIPLGIMGGQEYTQTSVQMEKGDALLIYTDGIIEAPAAGQSPRELFGTERLDQLLLDCRSISPADCIARIQAALADFTNNAAPADDQTLIALRSR